MAPSNKLRTLLKQKIENNSGGSIKTLLGCTKNKYKIIDNVEQSGSTDPPLQNGKVRIYSMRFCPYAQRVHLVLAAKKIPHDVVYINLTYKPEWYLEMFPLGKVPAIVIDGEFLYESLIISDFLDEKFPTRPLHSKDPVRKAKDRLLVESFSRVINNFFKLVQAVPNHQGMDELYLALDEFEKELVKRGTPFYGGDQPGMADYMLWPWCERLEAIRIITSDQLKLPKERFMYLFKWSKAMTEDEAVQSFYLKLEVHCKYLRQRKSGVPDYDNIIP